MNATEIRDNITALVAKPFDAKTFIFRFIEAYNAPKITVTKLENGNSNLAVEPTELLWKNKVYFRLAPPGKAADTVDHLASSKLVAKYKPQFLISTDGIEVYGKDLKADDSNLIDFVDLDQIYDFFLPLAGMKKHTGVAENPANIKATRHVAKLYDAIVAANPTWRNNTRTHELNLFMTRMLFCFFAEDTGIFEARLFTKTLLDLTSEDGSDTAEHITDIFSVMNQPDDRRNGLAVYLRRFPYVNGGLFQEAAAIPAFSKAARRILRECAELSWSAISPDIFGSMIQAVVHPDMRGDMGMHYTSIPNIMNVLEPLFLKSLRDEAEAASDSEAKLQRTLKRLSSIQVFDPACGSGNFLIIAYQELRRLEMQIFRRLGELTGKQSLPMTGIALSQFYGIELADFATETAKLSLWIAEYQMNTEFKELFGDCPPTLPLTNNGNIIRGNATTLDWLQCCPPNPGRETYVVGNPPYLGRAQQTKEQKAEIIGVFKDAKTKFKSLDYVACWIYKGAKYCKEAAAQCAFVATNSICCGEQVSLLWPLVFGFGMEISFAHRSFKWKNNASNNAGVTCVIVGLRSKSNLKRYLYGDEHATAVKNISPYLIDFDNTMVYAVSNKRVMKRPIMSFGSMPNDNGNLMLTVSEKNALVAAYPAARELVRRLYGSNEFIKGLERWCLWIEDDKIETAKSIPPIQERIEKVRAFRLKSDRGTTNALAKLAYRFGEVRHKDNSAIIMPAISSENRPYLPVGILPEDCIINNKAFAIFDPIPYIFAVLSSKLHYVWTANVGGRLDHRLNYTNTLVYNTFPMPELSETQKDALGRHALEIIAAREAHPGKTMAWYYNPSTMPANLLQAHQRLDEALEKIYIGRLFKNDTERLEHLFKLYARTASAQSPRKKVLANA